MLAPIREVVLNSIINTCDYYGWPLYAAHVHSNHVHLITESAKEIERVMQKIKLYCSRELNKQLKPTRKTKYWTHHGSTRYLWNDINLNNAMEYVVNEQGGKMACYCAEWFE